MRSTDPDLDDGLSSYGARQGPRRRAKSAFDHALDLLAASPKSTSDLCARLTRAGHPPDEIAAAIGKLTKQNLLDDDAFAADRARRLAATGKGRDHILEDLAHHGIDRATAAAALPDDDLERATALAAGKAGKLVDLPLDKQAARICGFLARRGFSDEVCMEATEAVLPPEGWD